ncbi:MAG: hypothetical protein ACR2IM_05955 [Sediminibacterium sp.]|jgi:hypothetical protein
MQVKYPINYKWVKESKEKAINMINEIGNIETAIYHCNTLANFMAYAQGDFNKPTFWDYVKHELEKIKNENYAN